MFLLLCVFYHSPEGINYTSIQPDDVYYHSNTNLVGCSGNLMLMNSFLSGGGVIVVCYPPPYSICLLPAIGCLTPPAAPQGGIEQLNATERKNRNNKEIPSLVDGWLISVVSLYQTRSDIRRAAYINAHKFIHLPARQLIRKVLGRSKKGAAVRYPLWQGLPPHIKRTKNNNRGGGGYLV